MRSARQCTGSVLMVQPSTFEYNPESSKDNTFSAKPTASNSATLDIVGREFDSLRLKLIERGVNVHMLTQSDKLVTPDAVFPNNWFSTHVLGTFQ
jgi:hypothetical protein